MTTVASRELRNHTADVLARVAEGQTLTITVNGRPVAELHPVRSDRKPFVSKRDLVELLTTSAADPALRQQLADWDQSTDDLGPIR